jgi:hypothetical protein
MSRPASAAVFLLFGAALCLAGSSPEVPPVPAVLPARPEEAAKAADDVKKAVEAKDDEALAKALDAMEGLRSDTFAPLIKAGLKSPNASVVAASLRAAAANEMKDVEKDAKKLLHVKPKKPEKGAADQTGMAGEVSAAAIDYLVRLEFAGEEQFILEENLEPLFTFAVGDDRRVAAPWARDLVRASVHYLGKFKYKRAVPMLVEMVADPQPKPMPAGKDTNPPEPYWRARAKLWQASEGWVRWALKEITGLEYKSPREWEAWLKMNKKDYK